MPWKIKEGFQIMQNGILKKGGEILQTIEDDLKHLVVAVGNEIKEIETEVEQIVTRGRKKKIDQVDEPIAENTTEPQVEIPNSPKDGEAL